ncbi:MAG: hypothetical protein U0W40_13655 [Acidimicrobiia bacterium]
MRLTSSRAALGGAVLAVALLTTACWRAAPIDGPSAPAGVNTTTDRVSDDKAATPISWNVYPNLMALVTTDSNTHTVRLGIYDHDQQWKWQRIDGPGAVGSGVSGDQMGGGAAIVQSAPGNVGPHLDAFYYDITAGTLRHSSIYGLSVTDETVDGPGVTTAGHTDDVSGQFTNATWMSGTVIHVVYGSVHPTSPGATLRLRHAWKDTANGSDTWHYEDVDGTAFVNWPGHTTDNVGQELSVAAFGGNEHVFYRDDTTHRLRHAVYNGTGWTMEDVDGPGVPGGGGRTTNVISAIGALAGNDGFLHAFYTDGTGQLHHAFGNGSSWSFQALDGPGTGTAAGRTGDHLFGTVRAVQNSPGPLIDVLYTDFTNYALRHAQWTGGGWRFEVIDGHGGLVAGGTGDQVGFPSITGAVSQQMNAGVYGGVTSSILHTFTGDLTTGDLREECTLGAGIAAPPNCNN